MVACAYVVIVVALAKQMAALFYPKNETFVHQQTFHHDTRGDFFELLSLYFLYL